MGEPVAVGIVGAEGRLGAELVREFVARDFPVVLRATRSDWRTSGTPRVVFDASEPDVLSRTISFCSEKGAALVACVSNLQPDQVDSLQKLAHQVPVVRAHNLSLGHWLQLRLVRELARALDHCALSGDAAVLERHPARKSERPSASAHFLASAWAGGRTTGPVKEVASYRSGLAVSSHQLTVTFDHETLSINHDVGDIRAAASWAPYVAKWAQNASSGLFMIDEVYDGLTREAAP